MKIVTMSLFALAATAEVVYHDHHHHHVSQSVNSRLQYDCLGCGNTTNWFCGKKTSPNFGKCSNKPFSDCTGATWQGIPNKWYGTPWDSCIA